MTDKPRPTSPYVMDLNHEHERNTCWLELDQCETDADLLAWVKKWREGVRYVLSNRGFPR